LSAASVPSSTVRPRAALSVSNWGEGGGYGSRGGGAEAGVSGWRRRWDGG
jgi:hypothetical protein